MRYLILAVTLIFSCATAAASDDVTSPEYLRDHAAKVGSLMQQLRDGRLSSNVSTWSDVAKVAGRSVDDKLEVDSGGRRFTVITYHQSPLARDPETVTLLFDDHAVLRRWSIKE
jgi:hypothetical protein